MLKEPRSTRCIFNF